MKRILSFMLALALVLLLGNIPTVANAEEITTGTTPAIEPAMATTVASGTCGDNLTWVLDDAGTLTISGTGEMTDDPWSDYDEIKKVIIEDGVTSINEGAFYDLTNITEAIIGKNVTSIGDYAFSWCYNLSSVEIPDSVTSIGNEAFNWCESLTNITIPSSVTSIGDGAFFGTYALESFLVDDNNPAYSNDKAGVLFNKDKTVLIQAPGAISGNYEIPGSVTSIDNWAFSECNSLTSVTIPDSVTNIGEGAFSVCDSLTKVTILGSVTSMGAHAFSQCYSLTSVTIKNGVTNIGVSAFNACNSLTSVTIPDSVTSIGDHAFSYCKDLASVTIPDSVTSIGDHAFYFCEDLTSVTIPDSVTSLEDNTFAFCSSLTSIVIPDGVTDIGARAFYECESLEDVTIGNGVTSIGESAFAHCSSLTNITIPKNVKLVGWEAFAECAALNTITFIGSAPEIDKRAFDNVTATAYYPAGNPTWTADVMKDYGGNITWKPNAKLAEPDVTVKAKQSNGKPYIDWDKVEDAEKYFVYRSTKKSSGFERIKSTTKTAYTDTTAKTGTKYYYKVKAIASDSDNNSDYSATKSCTAKLAQPEVSITGSSASGKPIVKWETVTGAAKYRVYRATSKNGDYELIYTGVKARSYTDKTAKAGTTYYYKVKAVHSKSSADSALSDVVSRLCDLEKPVVSITRKNGDPRLTWDKVDGAAKYYIYRATSKNGEYKKIKTTVSATSFTDTTAKAGKTYYYKVKAIHKNTDANSAYSTVKYITAK